MKATPRPACTDGIICDISYSLDIELSLPLFPLRARLVLSFVKVYRSRLKVEGWKSNKIGPSGELAENSRSDGRGI